MALNPHKPSKPFIPLANNHGIRITIRHLPVTTPPLVRTPRRSRSGLTTR